MTRRDFALARWNYRLAGFLAGAIRLTVRANDSGRSSVPSSRAVFTNAAHCSAGVMRRCFLVAIRGAFLMPKRPGLSNEVLDKMATLLRDWLFHYDANPKPELEVAREIGEIISADSSKKVKSG